MTVSNTIILVQENPYSGELKLAFDFLNTRENAIRMITASELGHPAIASVEPYLLEYFRDDIKQKDEEGTLGGFNKVLGKMVKRIMEANGFEVDKQDIPLHTNEETLGTYFIKQASSYKKTREVYL
ncbi:MAG: hypothetical protein ACK5MJ_02665 [Alphaproteobacteria bacterium]